MNENWTNFVELYLTEEAGKRYHGPWVKVKTLGLDEVSDVAIWRLPQDDQWREWKIPTEHQEFVDREFPTWNAPLWGRK